MSPLLNSEQKRSFLDEQEREGDGGKRREGRERKREKEGGREDKRRKGIEKELSIIYTFHHHVS